MLSKLLTKIPPLKLTSRFFRPAILICFFLSGACGLVYEVAWLRVMGLVFGNTTFATSTVLASYMAGLGLGAYFFGRWIDRTSEHPVKAYALLELGVAGYAFLTPLIWKLMQMVYVGFYRTVEPGFMAFSLFRFAIAFLVLIFPTFLMGGTLPVIAKFFVRQKKDTARYVGILYAVNTLGAVLGVLLCGFYLLYAAGVWQTVILTGCFNVLIFYACYSFASDQKITAEGASLNEPAVPHQDEAHPASEAPSQGRMLSILMLFLFAVSGALSMVYEVAWTRILAIPLGSSVYAFSVMLATFLLGIAWGSYLFSWISRKIRVDLHTFALLQMLTAVFVLLGLNQFDHMPYYFVRVYELSKGSLPAIEFGKFLLCAFVMLPPTLCIGAMFACFIHVYRRSASLGHEIGEAYFANTIGTILGSALTGFVIIPVLGIQNTLIYAACLSALIGLAAYGAKPAQWSLKRLLWVVAIFGLALLSYVFVHPWNKTVIASDVAVTPTRAKGLSQNDFVRSMKEREILFYQEGSSATVTVVRLRDNISLAVNGKVDASNQDAFTQFLLGHLPMMLHSNPKKVLVIGLGSGSTLAAVGEYPVEAIHGVELEKAVIKGSEFFTDLNRNILKDPRTQLFINDGRNFLLVNPDTYDVIISEPSNPWMAGVANLFSLEHYRTMSEHLNPGGIVCQWLHAYSMSTEDLKMIINTFTGVFKHVSLWTPYFPDLMLIGSNEPVVMDYERVQKILNQPQVSEDLAPYGVTSPEALLGSFWLGDGALRLLAQGGKINRDNTPYLEYSAPKHLYENTLRENFALLNAFRDNQLPEIKNAPYALENNARLYAELAKVYMSKRFMREAQTAVQKAQQMNAEDPEVLTATAMLNIQNQKPQLAEPFLLKALQIQPDHAEASYYLALVYQSRKAFGKANEAFRRAVEQKPDELTYLKAYGDFLIKQKKYSEALGILKHIRDIEGVTFETVSKVASVQYMSGNFQGQLQATKDILENYPKFGPAYNQFGKILEAHQLYPQAMALYQQMVTELPNEPDGYLRLAHLYQMLGRMDDARTAVQKAIKIDKTLASNPVLSAILKSE
ncbi:MAG: fused MFS/spermidine synthase [Candidatus Omnitrophica bacterium]|nr:fused MFS/spermidine synthase [Candidatus Omnitrophota bacterium]